MIRPIVLYNSENPAHLTHHQILAVMQNKTKLLTYMTSSYVDGIHQHFFKYILSVKRNCNNMTTLGELGEFPFYCMD